MKRGSQPGRVTTFYSYKGGTGRSMLLANVAWLLASAGERVLVMDWDLEAPGLHRYFKPFLRDSNLESTRGTINWLGDYCEAALESRSTDIESIVREFADPRSYAVSLNTADFLPKGGGIDLIGAGRQDDSYARLVDSFNFDRLYNELQGADFIAASKSILTSVEGYDHVLVDSRTGISDSAGICTVGLADSLVVCFTYNNQSVCGAAQVARSARAQQDAVRSKAASEGREMQPFQVFGVPARIETIDPDRLRRRRNFARAAFDGVVNIIEPGQEQKYWSEVEVPHHALYGYEEVLAVCMEKIEDPRGVLAGAQRIARLVCSNEPRSFPGLNDSEQKALRDAFERSDDFCFAPAATTAWDRISRRLGETEEQRATLVDELAPMLMQLYARPATGSAVHQRVRLRELAVSREERRMLNRLLALGVVTPSMPAAGRRTYMVVDDSVAQHWVELRHLLHTQGDVLDVRDWVEEMRRSWEARGMNLTSFLEVAANVKSDRRGSLGSRESWIGRHNQEFLQGILQAISLKERLTTVDEIRSTFKDEAEVLKYNGERNYRRARNVGALACAISLALGLGSTIYFAGLSHARELALKNARTSYEEVGQQLARAQAAGQIINADNSALKFELVTKLESLMQSCQRAIPDDTSKAAAHSARGPLNPKK